MVTPLWMVGTVGGAVGVFAVVTGREFGTYATISGTASLTTTTAIGCFAKFSLPAVVAIAQGGFNVTLTIVTAAALGTYLKFTTLTGPVVFADARFVEAVTVEVTGLVTGNSSAGGSSPSFTATADGLAVIVTDTLTVA